MISAIYIAIAIGFGLGFCILLVAAVVVRRRMRLQLEELAGKLAELEKSQAETLASLEERLRSLQEVIFERANELTTRYNEASKKINLILETNKKIMQEIDRRVNPLKVSFVDTVARVNSSHSLMKRTVVEAEKEIKKLGSSIERFAQEIQKMKDYIRERTIDLEL